MEIPALIEDTVCITENPVLGAVISSYFTQEKNYFSVLESPRLGRHDATNEVIKRNNLFARMEPEKIILADVSDEIVMALLSHIPIHKLIRIKDLQEVDSVMREHFDINEHAQILECTADQTAEGLLLAKLEKKILRINEKAKKIDLNKVNEKIKSKHIVIVDDRRWVAPIIAANYSYSIGAKMIFFPDIEEEDMEAAYDDIANSKYYANSQRGSRATRSLMSQQLTYDLYFQKQEIDADFITFITRGLPYGYFFPDTPSTHLFSYPELGLNITNNILYSTYIHITRSALLIDPGVFPKNWGTTETGFVSDQLSKRGVYVKELRDREAKVFGTSLYIQWYPYDLLFICSHAGSMKGRKLTVRFFDRKGKEHEIIVEEAVSFGLTDEGEGMNRLVEVMQFIGFVSMDGHPWRSEEYDKNVEKGVADDFVAIPREKWNVVHEKDIPFVRRSTMIKLSDGEYQATFHALSGGEMPIIFNNACVSFYDFSGRFAFAGARGYIGTLAPVDTDKAKEIAHGFFKELDPNKPLPILLWEVQRKVYPDPQDRVYMHFGTHFSNIIGSTEHDFKKYVKNHIAAQIKRSGRKLLGTNPPDVTRNLQKAVKFLDNVSSKM